ncbi:MAG: four helix bundle protein [Kiritimatiellae bacterium]|nr:four helix bundle protein [Kiritimatiellia bacterium]
MFNKGSGVIELEDRIVRFVARCIKVCAALPVKSLGSSSLADQMFRSSTSIAANYAEACEAESAKDFVHKLKVAMKELSETRIWLRLIGEADYVEKSKLADLIGESRELSRILSASVITAKKKVGG